MSKAVLFHEAMLKFLDACALYRMHYYLYDDLIHGCPPSEDSYRVLVSKHDAKLDVLRNKFNQARSARLETWLTLRRMMEKAGVYDPDDAEFFVIMVERRVEESDFRAKVRDWTRSELRKIEKGKAEPDELKSFKWYLDRYAELSKRRASKKK